MAPPRTDRSPSHRAEPAAPRRAHRAERPAARRPDQRVLVSAVVAGNALVLGGVLMAVAPTASAGTTALASSTSEGTTAGAASCLPASGTFTGTFTGTFLGAGTASPAPTATANPTSSPTTSAAAGTGTPRPTATRTRPSTTPRPTSVPTTTAPAPTASPTSSASAPVTTPAPAPTSTAPSSTAPPTTAPPTTPPPSTAPPTTAPPTSAPPTAPPAAAGLDPAAFGARGDGTTDDSAALQRALDSLGSGDVLTLAAGKSYAHSAVLRVRRDGVTITGGGTLVATRAATTALWVEADDVTVEDVTLTSRVATRRGGTWDDTTLLIKGADDAVVRDVRVDGSTAAGVMVTGSTDFTLDGVRVVDTLADGIHITDGSSRGTVTDARVTNSGDDGIAVVSYRGGGVSAVSDVDVVRPVVDGTAWGRGLSVVGGTDIAFTDVDVRASDGAGVYIASEANWGTDAPTRVSVTGGTLTGTNKSRTVDHGAVLVYSGDAARPATDITVSGLTLDHTADRASRETGVIGAAAKNVVFRDIRVLGGDRAPFVSNNPASGWTLIGWTKDGAPLADRRS